MLSLLTIAYLVFLIIVLFFFASTLVTNVLSGVPFVPTSKKFVPLLLGVADLKPHETFYDLGCGDGRLIFEATRTVPHLKGIGIENSPLPYVLARLRKKVSKARGEIRFANIFKTNLKDADVVFCYLFPGVMQKLKTKFKNELPKHARIISESFKIEGWEPEKIFPRDKAKGTPTIYVYKIARQIAG
jgi:SAM-dependent methyltransferase